MEIIVYKNKEIDALRNQISKVITISITNLINFIRI